MKILILVLSVNKEPWSSITKSQKETWAKNHDNVYFYFGDSNNTYVDGQDLYLTTKESWDTIGYKTLEAFEYFKDYDFDYIFRTNTSSYVDITRLEEYLTDKPREKFYSGVLGNCQIGNFASGCGYTLSKDVFDLVLKHKSSWNHNHVDDNAIALLLQQFNIKPIQSPRQDLKDFDIINKIDINYFHYRLKTTQNRMLEIKKMKDVWHIKNN